MRFFILSTILALFSVGCDKVGGASKSSSKTYTIHNNADEGSWVNPFKGEPVYFVVGDKRERLKFNQCVTIAGNVFSNLFIQVGLGGFAGGDKLTTLCGGEDKPCKPGNYVILNKQKVSEGSNTKIDNYVMESSNKIDGKCAHTLHGAEAEAAEAEESA